MLWVKTFHVLFVMGWMTCLFALPRTLLHWKYAVDSGKEADTIKQLSIRFFRFGSLMALLSIAFGSWLWLGYGIGGRWLAVKLAFVALLILYHMISGLFLLRSVKQGRFTGGVFMRVFNEASLLLVIPILYIVLAKPF